MDFEGQEWVLPEEPQPKVEKVIPVSMFYGHDLGVHMRVHWHVRKQACSIGGNHVMLSRAVVYAGELHCLIHTCALPLCSCDAFIPTASRAQKALC